MTSGPRDAMLASLADRVESAASSLPCRTTVVGIDGVDGAGKTHLADELAAVLAGRGIQVLRASIDDFHHPAAVRYRQGRRSPRGFFEDSFDLSTLRRVLLDPLRQGVGEPVVLAVHDVDADRAVAHVPVTPPAGGVLVFDGIFLHRSELADAWDLSVWLAVPFEVSVPRGAARDGTTTDPAAPSQRRYVEGQRLYLDRCAPSEVATLVVDNTALGAPRILTDPSALGPDRPTDN